MEQELEMWRLEVEQELEMSYAEEDLTLKPKKNKIHSIKCSVSTHPSSSVIFTSIGVSLLTSSSGGVGGHLDV